jgi:predicted RNA-binding protein with PIN domain
VPRRWVVDGMNVIGSRPTGWWRDRRKAMRRLVAELDRFAARTGDEVVVVLDGKPFELEGKSVEVRFATRRGRNAADDDIARLAEEDPDPGGLTAVTSDADLVERVRAAGAETIGAGSFLRMLDEAD